MLLCSNFRTSFYFEKRKGPNFHASFSHFESADFVLILQNDLFMMDSASTHYAIAVGEHLNFETNGNWIGRGGLMECPARYLELSSYDFFTWK